MSPDISLEQNHNKRTHHIAKLPDELIARLPDYLHSLDDPYAGLQTCRLFYRCCAQTEAKLAPPFAKLYGQHLLSPHPYLLLAGTARQGGDWATESEANRQRLWDVIKDGAVAGLTNLAVESSRLSLTDVRALHQSKYDITNPNSKTPDLEYGAGERERNVSFLRPVRRRRGLSTALSSTASCSI